MANITIHFGSTGADGMGLGVGNRFSLVLAAAPPVPYLSINFFPFPNGPDCCCPEDVACLHRSANGQYYAVSKGTQRLS